MYDQAPKTEDNVVVITIVIITPENLLVVFSPMDSSVKKPKGPKLNALVLNCLKYGCLSK